jgi:hypothetical protein
MDPMNGAMPSMLAQEPASAGFFMPEETPEYIGAPEPGETFGAAKTKLLKFVESNNLAEDLDEDELKRIGVRVVEDYLIDETSREEWLKRNKDAIKLANQIREEKTFPFPGAANVKLPLIADAAIKFAARASAEIIRDDQVVKGKVIGPDPDGMKDAKAQRVGKYMSWQLTEDMSEWEEDTDKLLHALPVVGHLFRKVFYDPSLKRSRTELVMPDKLCINNTAASLESARRVTHILENTHKNTVIENQRSGVWLDIDLDQITPDNVATEPDTEKYYTFLEQHKYLDLDDDGYEEPYIVTVEKDSQRVVRIVARYKEDDIRENAAGKIMRITPCMYFADYKFIPPFDGGYYYVGFGVLLAPLNETANSLFNMLLDSGRINNMQSGFLSKEIKVLSGNYRFTTGEWKKTGATSEQLARGIHPLPTKEPSPTLFNLLSLVMDLTKDLASVKDVLAGDAPGNNVPATTVLALIEEAKKTLNAIYKRIYRSLKGEFRILYDLNYEYMDDEEYYRVLDQDAKVYKDDFDAEGCDVIPVADPFLSSDMQRMARAQALQETIGMPGVNPKPILQYKYEAMRIEPDLIAQILPEEDPNAAPNPEVMKLQQAVEMKMADVQNKERELDLKERELQLKIDQAEWDSALKKAQIEKLAAESQAVTLGAQTGAFSVVADSMHREIEADMASNQAAVEQQQATQDQSQPQM